MKAKIFTGQFNIKLAEKVAKKLGQKLGSVEHRKFSDGEIWLRYKEDIQGQDIFIIQSFPPPADNFLELLLMIDAAKRARAKKIIAVIPYFGYARQDEIDQPGSPLAAKLITKLIFAARPDKILTIDIHSDRVLKFFKSPIENLSAESVFLGEFKKHLRELPKDLPPHQNFVCGGGGLVVLAPDAGSREMARSFSRHLGNCPVAVIDKERPRPGKVKIKKISGKVKNKAVLIVDDIIDTGNTLIVAAEAVKKLGAREIYACVTHGIFSGKAISKIDKSPISKLFITDIIPLPSQKRINKIKVISVAPLLYQTIRKICEN